MLEKIMAKSDRMQRTIRVYEETAQLIEAIMHVQDGKKFADVVEDWARKIYPDEYVAIKQKIALVEDMIRKSAKADE
jgi:hypothetical protein